jgi:hypothetical protein
VFLGWKMDKWLAGCSYSRLVLKISQTEGLRNLKCGVSLSPSALLRQLGVSIERRGCVQVLGVKELDW